MPYRQGTLLKQIATAQDKVNAYMSRVELLEKKLKSRNLTVDERAQMEEELIEIKEGIFKSQNDLKRFYGENRITMIFAVMLMFFSFLCYGLYLMIVGPKTKGSSKSS